MYRKNINPGKEQVAPESFLGGRWWLSCVLKDTLAKP